MPIDNDRPLERAKAAPGGHPAAARLAVAAASAVIVGTAIGSALRAHRRRGDQHGRPIADRYDVIVVGAGSAGCVMANRLSKDPDRSVLLIEAGPVYPVDGYPGAVLDGDRFIRTGRYTWGLRSEPTARSPAFDVAAGRLAGGGSAVNAGNIRRPTAEDIAGWSRHITGWSYADVIETCIAIENTPDGSDTAHGRDGPLPVRHLGPEQATRAITAFVKSARGTGFAEKQDVDAEGYAGVTAGERNVLDGVKMNTGIVYLTAAVRKRSNLSIMARTQVDRVIFKGRRAVGVLLANGAMVGAGEVVLSGGTYHSPAVLMRSGVGPAAHLAELGIEMVADLAVGQGLRDHPALFTPYPLRKGASGVHPAGGSVLAASSSSAEGGDLDLWVVAYNLRLPPWRFGRPHLMLGAMVMRPRSRGSVRLRSRDPRDTPRIDFNLLSDPDDRARMLEAVRLARRIVRTAPLADLISGGTPASAEADDVLMAQIEAEPGTFDHGHGTARMGHRNDPDAVTDRAGRVHGTEGLRVVDASIFPDTMSVPINLTTMMVAERIAAEMRTMPLPELAAAVRLP